MLVEEHYIIGFQIIGSLAPNIAECFPARAARLILSQVNSSALRSEWRLMLLLHLGNKDCLNPRKTGCFLYLF